MKIRFPRQVSGLRRVAIPKKLALAAAIPAEGFVLVERPPGPRAVLVMSPAQEVQGAARRDPERPRQLNKARQVALPAPLMDAIGLAPLQWVYLSRAEEGVGVLLEPAGVEL